MFLMLKSEKHIRMEIQNFHIMISAQETLKTGAPKSSSYIYTNWLKQTRLCIQTCGCIQMSHLVGKPTMWFPNRSDTNWPVQAQKRARSLKIRI